jgi:septal ring factor EnvC (AmiA/AmiB activator)
MRRLFLLLLLISMCLTMPSQTKKSGTRQTTTTTKKTTTKTTKKQTSTKKKQQSTKKKTQPSQKEQLQAQQKKLQQDQAAAKKRQQELASQVKTRLHDVQVLGGQIAGKREAIDSIRSQVTALENHIYELDSQCVVLRKELSQRQQRYIQSMRYMYRNRKTQNQLMFVLSARDFNQMNRRLRFTNEYATYQKAQGEAVKQKREQVERKQQELQSAREEKKALLARGEHEKQQLEAKQAEEQKMVASLQKEQKTVQALIAQQQREEAAINARIEKIIAEEIARAKAAEEARRRAEEARRKAEEEARRKAEAERKAAANANSSKTATSAKSSKATAKSSSMSSKSSKSSRGSRKSTAASSTSSAPARSASTESAYSAASADRRLSGSFASNKGRLPMPITGPYQLIRGFGTYTVPGLKGVTLESKGIYLKGQPGAQARCVFDGEVSGVFAQGSSYIVMVRHGQYISVYCNLARASVSMGQKVKTNQTLGTVGADNILQFQLRNWTTLLNPRPWLSR